jgi:hypothetical protein
MAIIRDLTVLGNSRLAGKAAGTDIQADKFITNGGTANQAVLGDGTLKALSEIGSIPNDGKLKIQVAGETAVETGFTADSGTDVTVLLSESAESAKFSITTTSNQAKISVTEIDGGTWT